ncbi:HlyD family efflux transporter periplasmic adaptor subunit [Aestuariicella hydrocarbonica]|uniref:HlyD family efflux transporter periplasmic adaptor subunit n=1 Tax=Pseudomaricurvus hydrocarbonicus TaxID=1470433 RepID=A0A9E5T406_9GAMM|nr:HlyD family efflux transporter periplasmic adaptor subunit [Aestuariicella hydrocarbonica]NHO67577.1 HlyD family efflux transporter periplasmic adaptor subunit [Aestuariicella hydrocarbonica]
MFTASRNPPLGVAAPSSIFRPGAIPLAGLILLLLSGCEPSVHQTALGTIERDRVILKAPASEIITRLPVQEGQPVAAGSLLVQLDPRRLQARVSKARAEQAQAAAHWAELRSGARIEDIDAAKARVSGAEAALLVAEKSYRRAQQLRQQKLSTEANLDQARAQRDSARASVQAAQKQLLVLTNGTRKEELDQAEAAFQAAEAEVELAQYELDELSIVATRNGYLDSLPWNLGERVEMGSPVAIILADNGPYARVYVPEPSRATLKVGDHLDIKVDGIKDLIGGRLRWIASEPAFTPYYALNERDRARLVYLAEVDLLDHTDIPVGVPAEVILAPEAP